VRGEGARSSGTVNLIGSQNLRLRGSITLTLIDLSALAIPSLVTGTSCDGDSSNSMPACLPIKLPCGHFDGQHCFENYRKITDDIEQQKSRKLDYLLPDLVVFDMIKHELRLRLGAREGSFGGYG
jgi:hypothetical protein